jgi:large subunit ribosomal protein L15
MFRLNDLTSLVKKKNRVGRGGKRGGTAGKGHKGQKARSGGGIRLVFEGGQMPLFRRLPKVVFSNAQFKKDVVAVDISMLNMFGDGQEVTRELLIETGIIKSRRSKGTYLLKFIGADALEKKLVVIADQFSKGAQEAINNAGGNAVVVTKAS